MNRDDMGSRHVIDEELKALLSDPVKLLVTNRDAMKKEFPWEGTLTHTLCALLLTQKGILLDAPRIRTMRTLVRSQVGAFSTFRGIPMLPLAAQLSMSMMPESDLARVLTLYEELKNAGFHSTVYTAETAMLALTLPEENDGRAHAETAHTLVRLQKDAHPFLESDLASLYAFLAAAAGRPVDACHAETEAGYLLLKKEFPSSGTTYALSRVLTLSGGDPAQTAVRAVALYDAFRAEGLKFGRHFELPALGVLSLLPGPVGEIAAGVKSLDTRLRAEKGFSVWSVQKTQRILFSASLYACGRVDAEQETWLSQGLMQSFTGVLIAAQTAAIAGAAAASSAAASSGSH